MRNLILVTVLLVLSVLLGTGQLAVADTYAITDLGTLGGTMSHAFDVNNHGQVVGESTTSTGETRAFLYDNGIMKNLGVLEPTHNTSQAFGVNDSGSVVGISFTKLANGDGVQTRPFVSNGSFMTMVGSLGGNYGFATGINNVGQIVGISADANGVTHAFLKTSGTMLDLGSFDATSNYSIAYDVNDSGLVTGYSTTGPSSADAFIFDGGGGLSDIGNLGGSSRGFAINNSNNVTGASIIDGSGHERAFLWHDGTLSNLGITAGAVTSQGLDINNLGEIVGTLVFDPSDGELNHGFFYRNGTMIDVNSLLPQNSGWVLRDAQAINDHEQIVGFGIFNGQEHAYLLSPFPGDYNRDGTVDGRDYVVWRHAVGNVVPPCSSGDANCNGFVEWIDYQPWRDNYGLNAGTALASASIPEPATFALCLAAALCFCGCRCKKAAVLSFRRWRLRESILQTSLQSVLVCAALCGVIQADQVTLTANDAIGQTSFNSGLHWSNGLAPSAANTYSVPPGRELRTPTGGGNFTFAGSSLTISGVSGLGGGVLHISGSSGHAITVNNLVLDYGYVVNSVGGTVTISGNGIILGNGGGYFSAGGVPDRSLIVSAPVSGNGNAFVVNPGTVHFTAANSYSGNTLIQYSQYAATLQLDDADAVKNSTVIPDADNALTFGSGIGSFNLGGLAGNYAVKMEDTTSNAVNVQVGLNGQSTTFGGVLSGSGSLTKIGIGMLTLTADNTYVGQTAVNEGILAINGSLDSAVTINNSGQLKGTGTIGKNIAVGIGGSVAPGSSVGSLHVNGDYAQVAGGQLEIEIGGTVQGSFDQLLVNGTTALAGLLSVSLTNGFSPQFQDAFDILSWGNLLGTFDNISLPPLAAGLTWNTSHLYSQGQLIVSLAGDFNFDQIVDNRDYLIWRHNLGYVVSPCSSGDANCNGFVEWSDYGPWRENWGRNAGDGSAFSGSSAVPEPTTLSFSIAACLLAWSFSSNRKMRS